MPTYEYRCKECGEHLEVVQSFRDDPLTECPRCAGTLKKVFQPVGIAFKGNGFYRNDSRSGRKSGASEATASSSSSSTSSSSESGAASGSGSSGSGSSGSSGSGSSGNGSGSGSGSSSSGAEAKSA
ncbi:MAG TPA: FmdB family zinc ribbon protein [Acidimicrobiales bacterium]